MLETHEQSYAEGGVKVSKRQLMRDRHSVCMCVCLHPLLKALCFVSSHSFARLNILHQKRLLDITVLSRHVCCFFIL